MDHENIVRYYQAWLEKCDGSEHLSLDDDHSIEETLSRSVTKRKHKKKFVPQKDELSPFDIDDLEASGWTCYVFLS